MKNARAQLWANESLIRFGYGLYQEATDCLATALALDPSSTRILEIASLLRHDNRIQTLHGVVLADEFLPSRHVDVVDDASFSAESFPLGAGDAQSLALEHDAANDDAAGYDSAAFDPSLSLDDAAFVVERTAEQPDEPQDSDPFAVPALDAGFSALSAVSPPSANVVVALPARTAEPHVVDAFATDTQFRTVTTDPGAEVSWGDLVASSIERERDSTEGAALESSSTSVEDEETRDIPMVAPGYVAAARMTGVVEDHPTLDVPLASQKRKPTHVALTAPAPRFDNLPETAVLVAATSHSGEQAPTNEEAALPSVPSVDNPWDRYSGDGDAVDLDNVRGKTASGGTRRPVPSLEGLAVTEELPQMPPQLAGAVDGDEAFDVDNLLAGARELFALGDFTGSMELVAKILTHEPNHVEATAYANRNSHALIQMYESKIGPLDRRPTMLTSADEIIWMDLHHRAGFLLSQVDGTLSYEDLIVVAGMPRLEAVKILAQLVKEGVIGLRG